jgi:eukaryotic-like serine/threonine-protein kinase
VEGAGENATAAHSSPTIGQRRRPASESVYFAAGPRPMPLSVGTRLGSFDILERIGAGGMGEVYRARDTKLGRAVAIKILPESFANDPERLARFEREAKTLAALNHSNIAVIHGFEEARGIQALVMELVEGPTLAERIAEGFLSTDEALSISKQIAEALAAAHEQGIIHRDLKPANIKVRPDGTVKVLDFGLAKALESVRGSSSDAQSPTITSPAMMTQIGVILGTAAYMAPEQAKGRATDRRTDMWAFGCVLYEMLTGKRAFQGDDVSDTLAGVLRGEPDWTALPRETPTAIRRLLRRCLAKDSKARIGDAWTARIEITDAQSEPEAVGQVVLDNRRWRLHLTWPAVLALVVLIAGGALVWITNLASVPSRPLARFTISLPTGQQFSNPGHRPVVMSPDGSALVYTANQQLHLRPLDQLEAVPIRSSTAGRSPFFSPDGQWIGFWQSEQLKKVSISGGAPVVLCSARNPWGVSWTAENSILYGQGTEGIWRVSADGGKPENVVKVDANRIASGPQLLPGGRAILFTLANPNDLGAYQIVVQSLDAGTRQVVVEAGADARYVPTGHLIYALRDTLMAVRFDVASLIVTGGPVPLVEDVAMSPDAVMAYFAVSNEGALVYVPRDAVAAAQYRTLVWVDRQGREASIKAPPRAYNHPRLSPDGTRVALDIRDQEHDIWIWDLAREMLTRLTVGPAWDLDPVWTPDGRSVIFSSGGPSAFGVRNLFRRAADGTGTVDQLTRDTTAVAKTVTPDGKGLIFIESSEAPTGTGDRGDVMLLPLPAERRPQPLVQTAFSETNAELSPNGRWLAYQSNESGHEEVYVVPFPKVATSKTRVSPSGGGRPVWARNGREIFYLSMSALMRVPVTTDSTFAAGNPSKLFEGPYLFGPTGRTYDVSPDGQRFLMLKQSTMDSESSPSARMVLVQNWFEELKRRVPTK